MIGEVAAVEAALDVVLVFSEVRDAVIVHGRVCLVWVRYCDPFH
jgi:hypothetical protein